MRFHSPRLPPREPQRPPNAQAAHKTSRLFRAEPGPRRRARRAAPARAQCACASPLPHRVSRPSQSPAEAVRTRQRVGAPGQGSARKDGGGGDLLPAAGPGRSGGAEPAARRQVSSGADFADRGEDYAHRPGSRRGVGDGLRLGSPRPGASRSPEPGAGPRSDWRGGVRVSQALTDGTGAPHPTAAARPLQVGCTRPPSFAPVDGLPWRPATPGVARRGLSCQRGAR